MTSGFEQPPKADRPGPGRKQGKFVSAFRFFIMKGKISRASESELSALGLDQNEADGIMMLGLVLVLGVTVPVILYFDIEMSFLWVVAAGFALMALASLVSALIYLFLKH